MSDLPTDLHAWNARCQAWNLMSDLPTGLHAWNSWCEIWNMMSDLPTCMECHVSSLESGVRFT